MRKLEEVREIKKLQNKSAAIKRQSPLDKGERGMDVGA